MTPEEIGDTTKAIVANAGKLGLIWNIRPGTVVGWDTDETLIVRMDGDSDPIEDVITLDGLPAKGSRVYVVSIPDGSNYVIGSAGSSLPEISLYRSDDTWNPPINARYGMAEAIGGGGAGGGAVTNLASQCSMGAGGGGGGWAKDYFEVAGLRNIAVTVGGGGTGVSGTTGNNGGPSSFDSIVAASGGDGGTTRGTSAVPFGISGSSGGAGTTGAILGAGTSGGTGWGDTTFGISGHGGSSGGGYGGGGPGIRTASQPASQTGNGGTGYGGGGSGAITAGTGAQVAGGPGADGAVIITTWR